MCNRNKPGRTDGAVGHLRPDSPTPDPRQGYARRTPCVHLRYNIRTISVHDAYNIRTPSVHDPYAIRTPSVHHIYARAPGDTLACATGMALSAGEVAACRGPAA